MKQIDFFVAQEEANRKSSWLRIFFLVSTFIFSAAIGFAIAFIHTLHHSKKVHASISQQSFAFAIPTAIAVFLVLILSAYLKALRIKKSGIDVLLLDSGAVRILPLSTDAYQRRFLNVAQEMSIASGVPIPSLYVLPMERSINAFAAGFSPSNAAIVISDGALKNLSRTELQGVVAHEFSHILNSDIKINLNLVSIVYGFGLLSSIGESLLPKRRVSNRNRDSGYAVAIGLTLLILGFFGKVIGSILKAYHSRQREWLADASAVQFTRSQDGLRGALEKIDMNSDEKITDFKYRNDFSHMFFVSALRGFFETVFASHPPIEQRIRNLGRPDYNSPSVKMEIPEFRLDEHVSPTSALASLSDKPDSVGIAGAVSPQEILSPSKMMPKAMIADEALRTAQNCLQNIPVRLIEDCRSPLKASAIAIAIFIWHGSNTPPDVISFLRDKKIFQHSFLDFIRDDVLIELRKINFAEANVVLELAIGTLKAWTPSEKVDFLRQAISIVYSDNYVSIREVCLVLYAASNLLDDNQLRSFEKGNTVAVEEISHLVMCVALVSTAGDRGVGSENFSKMMDDLGVSGVALPCDENIYASRLIRAIGHIRSLDTRKKNRFAQTVATSISVDSKVTKTEFEVMKTLCACLGCPMPLATSQMKTAV